jgi:hypothetical protein
MILSAQAQTENLLLHTLAIPVHYSLRFVQFRVGMKTRKIRLAWRMGLAHPSGANCPLGESKGLDIFKK